jgi:co-chaperonin GroES (HSP10)
MHERWKEEDVNPTNVQPFGPRVLVKRLAEASLTSSLIEVVQLHDNPSQFAVVLAVGKLVHGGIEIGDTVATKSFVGAPLEVEVEGQTIEAFMLMEADCLAVTG